MGFTQAERTKKVAAEMGVEIDSDGILRDVSIADKYAQLKATVVYNFDERAWFMLDACLSVIATLFIEDLSNPIGLNLVDGPASEKTTVLSMLYGLDTVYRCDNFTPASFVSHAANRKSEQLTDVDLLPRIRDKCIIVPELAPIFGLRKEDLLQSFSILTRVFDGEGLKTNSGSHGERGYEGEYPFSWLGATTPISQEVWNTMAQLGSRMLFLTADSRLNHEQRVERAINNLTGRNHYKQRVKVCKDAIREFFSYLVAQLPRLNVSSKDKARPNYAKVIEWNVQSDDHDIIRKIACAGELTARARSVVKVWKSEDGSNGEMGYTQPIIEGPDRILSVLYGVARGHAIINGRDHLTNDDLPLVIAVSLSSMPDDRRQVIDLLIDGDNPIKSSGRGVVTSSEAADILTYCRNTVSKIFEKLDKLGIGTHVEGVGPQASRFEINPFYNWLLTDDFASLRRVWDSASGNQEDIPF